MTQQNDISERPSPEIISEEDAPLTKEKELEPKKKTFFSVLPDKKLGAKDNLRKELTWFRYKTGKSVLFWSMFIMCLIVGVDLYSSSHDMNSDLLENAFEAFKLITMTVLGYIFGSDHAKSE